jgi:anti-sigma-K factor RskA
VNEHDSLSSLLREWEAPKPSAGMDARIRAAYRARRRPSLWRRFWTWRASIPVPVLAALVLVVVSLWIYFRPSSPAVRPGTAAPGGEAYMSRIESAGFRPLPDGAVRIIRSRGEKQ